MAGRILGALLIAKPPYQSATQLADTLQASKGSLSTMTRLLLQMGLIERVGLPGHRSDYFRIKPGAWTALVRQTVYELTAMRQLAERGLELIDNEDTDTREGLAEAHDLYGFLEREYPLLIEQWEKERQTTLRKKK